MKKLCAIALSAVLATSVAVTAETFATPLLVSNENTSLNFSADSSQRTGRWVTYSSMLRLNAPINKTIYGQPNEKGEAFAYVASSSIEDGQPLEKSRAMALTDDVVLYGGDILISNATLRKASFAPSTKKPKRFSIFKRRPKVDIYTAIPSRKTLNALPKATGDAEWACLTEALYFEARGESISGIFAVAEVILNRRTSAKFPDTVCKVISQGAHRKNACQFSYKCDGHKEVFREKQAKELVAKIAQIVVEERAPLLTEGATFYHANSVRPRWARSFSRTAKIGKHLFYRG